MPRPFLYQCERCGQQAALERMGRFRDEDFYEAFQELMDAQARVRELARHSRGLTKLIWNLENEIAYLKGELALQVAERAQDAVDAECPF